MAAKDERQSDLESAAPCTEHWAGAAGADRSLTQYYRYGAVLMAEIHAKLYVPVS